MVWSKIRPDILDSCRHL